jgi:hypothetical protein
LKKATYASNRSKKSKKKKHVVEKFLQDRIMSNVSIGVPYFFSEISSLTQRSSG